MPAMSHAERFRAVMAFQPVDRLPRIEWASWWDQTIARWRLEGLPETVQTGPEITAYFRLDPYRQHWFSARNWATIPPQPHHGAGHMTQVTDYPEFRKYLYPPIDDLLPKLAQWQKAQEQNEALVWITLEGFFWFPRLLMGIESHLYAFYDYPEIMHAINHDLLEYHLQTLSRVKRVCRPVFLTIAEDLSYNHGPMLSREVFDEFLAPYYRRLVPALKDMAIFPIVDSDGDITQMVPWYKDVGIECILPLERQAGVDAATLRRAFPTFRMLGHFDKMTMPRGEQAMRAEFERLLPVLRTGGFIPGVDHQTPPGVSLENYRVYRRLLDEYASLAAR